MEFKILKKVSVPSISFKDKGELYFKPLEAMHAGKKVKADEEPATLMRVVELISGQMFDLLVPTVLASKLHETYPDDTYVGRCFAAYSQPVPGKRYKDYMIDEIEVEIKKEENKK